MHPASRHCRGCHAARFALTRVVRMRLMLPSKTDNRARLCAPPCTAGVLTETGGGHLCIPIEMHGLSADMDNRTANGSYLIGPGTEEIHRNDDGEVPNGMGSSLDSQNSLGHSWQTAKRTNGQFLVDLPTSFKEAASPTTRAWVAHRLSALEEGLFAGRYLADHLANAFQRSADGASAGGHAQQHPLDNVELLDHGNFSDQVCAMSEFGGITSRDEARLYVLNNDMNRSKHRDFLIGKAVSYKK